MKKIKIAVTYVEAGMGHITSAKAVSDALKNYYGDRAEVIDVDFFKCTKDPAMINMEKSMISQVKMASKMKTWGNFLFQMMSLSEDTQKLLKYFYLNTAPTVRKKSMELIEDLGVDVIVNTHYLPAHFAEELRAQKKNLKLKTVIYNPDNNVHGWWDNRCDILINNNPFATQEAVDERGFRKSKVLTVDYLARNSVIETNGTKEEYRKKYNLKPNNFTVILADGAYASANMKSYTTELLKSNLPLTVIPVAGKNKTILEYFQKMAGKTPRNIDLRPIGFTNDICEYYKASDIFVTKAGPNAILDSMFMHTPIIINYWATPIEEYTKNLFVDYYGCGEVIRDKEDCKYRIEQFVKHPSLITPYIENTMVFDKTKNGGKQIADAIINMFSDTENPA